MFKSIKNLKKDVEEIKKFKEEVIGKDRSSVSSIYDLWEGYIGSMYSSSGEKKKTKTLFERIESLEESISRIEKHLGIKWVKEEKKFEGYKTTKKIGRPRKNK